MASAIADIEVAKARAIGTAASALARALQRDPESASDAADQLELQGTLAVDTTVEGFDSGGSEPALEDRLAGSVSSLGIGLTLLSAEVAMVEGTPETLTRAVEMLERNADAQEAAAAPVLATDRFDTAPGGVPLGRLGAALAALDEMAATAGEVVTAILDKALKPLVEKLPEEVSGLLDNLELDLAGRIARIGLRAIRRGMDLLLSVVDLKAVDRARSGIDDLLSRLGQGEDAAVLAGWAIGVDQVRAAIGAEDALDDGNAPGPSVHQLALLAERYSRICATLRRIAVLVVGFGGLLALLQVTLPHALAVTSGCLGLVLGAAVVIGRDYTGASDLPGRVRGVRLVAEAGD